MTVKDKKMAVLQILVQEKGFISLNKIMSQLPKSYVPRTVRRWLASLEQEGLIERRGIKKSTVYKIYTEDTSQETNIKPFSEANASVIKQVKRPLYERKPVTYDLEWIHEYQPNKTFYIPLKIRKQLLNAGKRSNDHDHAGSYAHQIFNRLLIDLSYNSSRLEGNTYSLLDTERLVLQGKSAEGKLEVETIMILNHKEAIRYLVDTAPKYDVMTLQIVGTIHYLLSDGLVESRYSGKPRDHGVRISGSSYIPLENPQHLQRQLELILKKASLINDPYEKSFFLLIHLSYLQYFTDVNKRTARLVANIPLIENNLVPLSFNDVDRDDYTSAMIAVYELKNIKPILDLYVFSYLRTAFAYDATVKSIGVDEIRVRYRQQRRMLVRDIITKHIVKNNIMKYVDKMIKEMIPQIDQDAFTQDVLEDIAEIDESRIVGLGITANELNDWLKLQNKK